MTDQPMPTPVVTPDETVEFIIHGTLAPRVIAWLQEQGFWVHDWPEPEGEPDRLRALMVVPGASLMGAHPRDKA